jgi:hypothetical protein
VKLSATEFVQNPFLSNKFFVKITYSNNNNNNNKFVGLEITAARK